MHYRRKTENAGIRGGRAHDVCGVMAWVSPTKQNLLFMRLFLINLAGFCLQIRKIVLKTYKLIASTYFSAGLLR